MPRQRSATRRGRPDRLPRGRQARRGSYFESVRSRQISASVSVPIFEPSKPNTNNRRRRVGAPNIDASTNASTIFQEPDSLPRAASKTDRFRGNPRPRTFSITKNAGRTAETIRKNSPTRLRRGSSSLCAPFSLKGWQGGPPTTPSTPRGSRFAMSAAVKEVASRSSSRVSEKFVVNELVSTGSTSMASSVLKLAHFAPSESPPAPA